jgi:hypothetical protein
MDGNIEKYAALIDNPGRAHIRKVLRTHSNPAQALIELQQTLGFKYSANIGEMPDGIDSFSSHFPVDLCCSNFIE